MKDLALLSPEQLARAEERLRHPRQGSRIEAAARYGIDMTLLIEQLRLSPADRARKLESASRALGRIRGAARRQA